MELGIALGPELTLGLLEGWLLGILEGWLLGLLLGFEVVGMLVGMLEGDSLSQPGRAQ